MERKPIRLMRCEDLGPGTHLLNGLRLEDDPWTFIVVVDDDHIYGGNEIFGTGNCTEFGQETSPVHPGSSM